MKSKLFGDRKHTNKYGRGKSTGWVNYVNNCKSYLGENVFRFLNVQQNFGNTIIWNYQEHGKLWVYNLTYFEYLNQEEINSHKGQKLIKSFIKNYDDIRDGKESFPTSLRIINWIKFFNSNQISNKEFDDVLGEDVDRLLHNLEYHLLANHLLENAFALTFAAYYFRNERIYNLANALLKRELNKQILKDGAHYELSPMYHQIMLYRLLDVIQIIRQTNWKSETLELFLVDKAKSMLGWLKNMTFSNGDIPYFNDAAKSIAPTSSELFEYAKALSIEIGSSMLDESGYRKFKHNDVEFICDVCNVIPSYQPGHTHADTFSFILYKYSKPYLVEGGTSTYETNTRRKYERSTRAHNTVEIDNKNSSEVWSSFRMGKRAEVNIIRDSAKVLSASHNGYRSKIHSRSWEVTEDGILRLEDSVSKNSNASAYFHLHPDVKILERKTNLLKTSLGKIHFENHTSIEYDNYDYSDQWNTYKQGEVIKVNFQGKLFSLIGLK